MSSDGPFGLVASFVRNPVAANLLMLCIIVMGLVTAGSLRREGFPSVPSSTITIEIAYPSGSPERTEEGVVLKIESALQGASGIKKITSEAKPAWENNTWDNAMGHLTGELTLIETMFGT